MQITHDDVSIAFELHNFVRVTFYCQCEELFNTFIYLNEYVGHDILSMEYIFKKYPFVSWFKILSQYDASITFLLGFGMAI
jgi:hypothetical protein